MSVSEHLARWRQIIAVAVMSAATFLLIVRFRQGAEAALEAPIMANAVAIAAGLVVAGSILAGMRRQTAVRARRADHD